MPGSTQTANMSTREQTVVENPNPYPGIQFRVTRETRDDYMAAAAPSTSAVSASVSPSGHGPPAPSLLSPHFAARNSLCSASDYSLRRRRPITLKIMPRLSLPCRSTSAPASTDSEWADIR